MCPNVHAFVVPYSCVFIQKNINQLDVGCHVWGSQFSTANFVKFRGAVCQPRKIVRIPQLATASSLTVNCTDFGPVVEGYTAQIYCYKI